MHKYSINALTGSKHCRLAVAVAASFQISIASAQEPKELPISKASAQTEDSYKVGKSTSEKYTQPLLNTAKTISVIPQSVMKDRNVDSLRDALRNVPGISMAAGEGGTPTGDQMSIRGFDARNSIMIDGVRDIAGYSRDMYNVESVEVAKGPGSAVYGRGSTGGSVNLQTKTAKLDEFNDVSLRLGSESDYRAQLDSNMKITETMALRLNILSDDGDVAGRDEVYNSKNAAAISFATGIATDSRLSINADFQKQDNLPDYGLPWVSNSATSDPIAELASSEGKAPPVAFSNFYGNLQRDYEDIQGHSITAKYEKDFAQSTTLRTLLRTGTVERESVVTAPRFISLVDSTDVRMSDEKTRDTKDSLTVLQIDLLGAYQTGAIHHDIVVGLEVAKEKFQRWNFVDVVDDNLDSTPVLNDLYNPNPNLNFTGLYGRDGQDEEATGDTTALYMFDTLTFNPLWQLSLGMRYDIFKTEYYYDLSGNDPSLKFDAENKELSWNFGLVYKPSNKGSIYFGAGNSFAPTAEDLTVSSNSTSNQNELDPEQTISYELGTKWEFIDGKLYTSAAIFRTEKNKALTDDPFFNAESIEGNRSRYDTLNGEQRVDGVELSAAGQVTEKLSITAAYTYQDSEIIHAEGDDAGQVGYELPRTPEHSFSLWGRYDFSDKLAAGFGAQYIGERFNSSDPNGRETADTYLVFDMMVSYQFNEQWNMQLNGANLSDKEYEDQLGGGHFVPGDGRYFTLSARYSF